MIVAEQPKREYEVRTYVVPLCPKCGKAMECGRTTLLLRYFYCKPCGESQVLRRNWTPPRS